MSNTGTKWKKLISMALFMGIGIVQIIFAVLWAVSNGNNVQDFFDSAVYLSNAEMLNSDGWRLPGYSVFIRFFGMLQGIMGEHYVIVLYIFQVGIAWLSFTEGIRGIYKILYGEKTSYVRALLLAIYLLTIPIVWQMQFAILPDSLCLSLTVLLFAKLSECLMEQRHFRWDCLSIIVGVLLLLGVLERHYFYGAICFTAVEILIMLLKQFFKKYRSLKTFIFTCTLMVLVTVLSFISEYVNQAFTKDSEYVSYSIEVDLWSRFVYPNIEVDYEYYSSRITDVISEHEISAYAGTYECYLNSVGPMLEISNSTDASSMYLEMVQVGWNVHKEELKEATVKEIIAYTLMPIAMVKYMYSSGNSLYGHNYTKMHEIAPELTANYMHVGMNGLAIICIIGCLTYMTLLFGTKKRRSNMVLSLLHGMVGILCITIPIMILSVARFDYRIGLFSVFIWAGFALVSICGQRSKGDSCGQEKDNK